jgi:hypothetical protein
MAIVDDELPEGRLVRIPSPHDHEPAINRLNLRVDKNQFTIDRPRLHARTLYAQNEGLLAAFDRAGQLAFGLRGVELPGDLRSQPCLYPRDDTESGQIFDH